MERLLLLLFFMLARNYLGMKQEIAYAWVDTLLNNDFFFKKEKSCGYFNQKKLDATTVYQWHNTHMSSVLLMNSKNSYYKTELDAQQMV